MTRRALTALRSISRQHTTNSAFRAARCAYASISGAVEARCTPLKSQPEVTRLLPYPVPKQSRRGSAQLIRSGRPGSIVGSKTARWTEGATYGAQALVKLVRIVVRQICRAFQARGATQLRCRTLQEPIFRPSQRPASWRAVIAPGYFATPRLILTDRARDARAHPALRLISPGGAQRCNSVATSGACRAERRVRVRGLTGATRCVAAVADDALWLARTCGTETASVSALTLRRCA